MQDALERLCRACGECCAGLPVGPMCTNEDLVRLVKATKITGPMLACFAAARTSDKDDLMSPCPCLERTKEGFRCVVYNERPGVCQSYKCSTYAKIEHYLNDGMSESQAYQVGKCKAPSTQPHSFSSQLPAEFPARIGLAIR